MKESAIKSAPKHILSVVCYKKNRIQLNLIMIRKNYFDFKTVVLVLFVLLLNSCKEQSQKTETIKNNAELEEMVANDQEMRMTNKDEPMEPKDKIHRQRVMELLSQNLIITPDDKFNAALILQHTALTYCNNILKSISPENYYLAYTLAKSSSESGNKDADYLVAAAYDRFLLYTEGYQKYGTQKVYYKETDEMLWAPIDTLTTDEERKKYGVKALSELLKEGKMKTTHNTK